MGFSQQENSVPEQNPQPAEFIRDMQTLKKTILAELSKSEKTAILATTLIQTAEWVLDGNTVKTTVASNFTQSQLQKQAAQISAIISQYYGENLQFSVSIKQAEKEITTENKEVLNLPNEPFLNEGRLIPIFDGENWNYRIEEFAPEDISMHLN